MSPMTESQILGSCLKSCCDLIGLFHHILNTWTVVKKKYPSGLRFEIQIETEENIYEITEIGMSCKIMALCIDRILQVIKVHMKGKGS